MRLWEDGFDHYGTAAKMLDGPYASSDGSIDAVTFASGTNSFYVNSVDGAIIGSIGGLRKVLPTSVTKIGVAARFYFAGLPSVNYDACIFDFCSAAPDFSQVKSIVDANGAIRFVRGGRSSSTADYSPGSNGTLIATTDPILVANAWNHVEIQINIHATAGWIRVAVNGVHKYQGTNLNTLYDATGIVSVMQHRPNLANNSSKFYIDDMYFYDFTGNPAVDTDFCPTVDGAGLGTSYIGDLQVLPLYANADTATADWLKSSGTVGYSLINEHSPDDTGYVYATTAGNVSEFDIDDLPTLITYIRGLGIHARLSKSDAGAAQTQVGMKSAAATTDATARPVTTQPTYWRDTVDLDPNTAARWTRTSLNAGKLRLKRSI
jgi:hypothetical protein